MPTRSFPVGASSDRAAGEGVMREKIARVHKRMPCQVETSMNSRNERTLREGAARRLHTSQDRITGSNSFAHVASSGTAAWVPAGRRRFARAVAPIEGEALARSSVSRSPASRIKTGGRIRSHRCYGNAGHFVPFYRLGDESRGFCLLGEFAEVLRAGGASLQRADRLLHRRETPFEHARAGKLLRVHHEAPLEPGEHVELVRDEQLVGSVDGRRAVEVGALQVSREIQVVGALRANGDAHAFAV